MKFVKSVGQWVEYAFANRLHLSMIAKGQDNHQKIVDVANKLFYQRGYNQTSFAEIAEVVGIPKGNFYYYFKSKDDLLAAVIDHRIQQITSMLVEWDVQYKLPKERLHRFISMLLNNEEDLVRYGCPMGSLNVELSKTQPEMQTKAKEMFAIFVDWLMKQFDELGRGGEARELALHFMARAQGVSLIANVYADPVFLRNEVEQINRWIDEL